VTIGDIFNVLVILSAAKDLALLSTGAL